MTSSIFWEVRIQPQGRVVIPAELRQAMSLVEGEQLIARVEDGRLIFERRGDIARRLQSVFSKDGPSPVEALIAKRRLAAERE